MKSDPKLLETLNSLLAEELTAINQYMVHAEMAEDWGYEALHKQVEARAITEMKHAEKLIERILFLEGKPIVSNLREIRIGAEVPKQFANDLSLEVGAVKSYNAAIEQCRQLGDNATREILNDILEDEDGHVDKIEEQLDQIKQLGIELYLSTQTDE